MSIPVDAGTLFKFVNVIKAGHLVVYPTKSDRKVNIGRFTGGLQYGKKDQDGYPTRQSVEWLKHIPRSDFSQSALNEIRSFLTLFRVKRFALDFFS